MSKNIFNSVMVKAPKRSMFDLSHDVKVSCNMGELVPVMLQECLPGDKFKLSANAMVRFAPLVSPVMHRFNVFIHYFFVPNRILWRNWEDFITNTKSGVGDTLPAFPQVTIAAANYTRLADYLGIPTPLDGNSETVSALPFAAMQAIWAEYYRDQNLIDDFDYTVEDGDNSSNFATELGALRRRAWMHDYFTSCLPWPQKGEVVDLPLGQVELDTTTTVPGIIRTADITHVPVSGSLQGDLVDGHLENVGNTAAVYDPNGTLVVGATTINDLRTAWAVQGWLELLARGGSRYTEYLKVQFDVTSSDKRLQRPEYICGIKSPVIISEIQQTSSSDVTSPQGNLAGHAISFPNSNIGRFYCEEHGYIIGVMSIMPVTAYFQGIDRHWLRQDPTEYGNPSFANLGEQAVENKEIMAFQGASGELTFGYNPRFSEYKFQSSRVAGDFREQLAFWHEARIFGSAPALNQEFIECNPDPRIFAVTDPDVQKMYCQIYNNVKAVRCLPKFGIPATIV